MSSLRHCLPKSIFEDGNIREKLTSGRSLKVRNTVTFSLILKVSLHLTFSHSQSDPGTEKDSKHKAVLPIHHAVSPVNRTCFLPTTAGSDYWKNTVVCISLRNPAEATNLHPAATLFCWFSWQNRSHYLVYPHGNLTVYHVTYIFSTDSGLRQASEEKQLIGEFRGSQKFAWYDQDKSLMPCFLWIWGFKL